MLSFTSDYIAGAHPEIMKRLAETNLENLSGYGTDKYCEGAIEYTGHKVLEIAGADGKLSATDIEALVNTFHADENHEHMVFPGMVYLSFPTEYGTLYTKDELTAISDICRKHQLLLYIDGARLGYGLASHQNAVTLKELARLCDVFYIGGTKVGALCGEAVVFTKNNAPKRNKQGKTNSGKQV